MEYQIGDFSKISRLSIKTLRYYHEYGLLSPVRIDDESGYRYYDESSLEKARIIEQLKELEFSLKDIKEILEHSTDDSDITGYITLKINVIKDKLDKYDRIYKKLDSFIERSRHEVEIKMTDRREDIVIKEIQDILIASIRFKGRYADCGQAFSKLFKGCGRYSAGAPFSLYYDNEFRENDADMEVCVPVKKAVTGEGISCRLLKGGKAVTIIHKGSYDSIGEAYKQIIDYINSAHQKAAVPSREIYLKGPGMILPRSPKKFITELQIMIF